MLRDNFYFLLSLSKLFPTFSGKPVLLAFKNICFEESLMWKLFLNCYRIAKGDEEKKGEHSRVASAPWLGDLKGPPKGAGAAPAGLHAVLGESRLWASGAHRDRWMDGAPLPVTRGPRGEVRVRTHPPHAAPPRSGHTWEPHILFARFSFPPSRSRSLLPPARLSPMAILVSVLSHPLPVSSMVKGVCKVPVVGSEGAPSPSQDQPR